ncbi:MAG TPA: RIP metalloprotease RseP [Verrucomicrobiae bacterium]|jgi:regulator of sigma E protease|nr:RIP metalloprotease RseP [Verrucomicrobiae bacterium]
MLNVIQSVVSAVIGLGILIVIHELGHFLVAKKSRVGVLTFSIGFGPKLLRRKVGETEYAVSAIPFGGYVKMIGEDPQDEVAPAEMDKAFSHQPLWKRAAIVAAGPISNLLLAFFIFAVVMMFSGVRTATTHVGDVVANNPAAKAGIQKGDQVTAINGRSVESWTDFARRIKASDGGPLKLTIVRDDKPMEIVVNPIKKEERDAFGDRKEVWFIGISPQDAIVKVGPLTAIYKAFEQTRDLSLFTIVALFKMIKGDISPKTLGGPLLIAQVAGQQAREGVTTFFLFVALLSINLGVLNLLPIPVLDGGHLFFFLIEAILGRPVGDKQRERAQQVGVVLLILVMAYAFYNDIARFFEG